MPIRNDVALRVGASQQLAKDFPMLFRRRWRPYHRQSQPFFHYTECRFNRCRPLEQTGIEILSEGEPELVELQSLPASGTDGDRGDPQKRLQGLPGQADARNRFDLRAQPSRRRGWWCCPATPA